MANEFIARKGLIVSGSTTTTGNITAGVNLVSNFSSGDEGGEILLAKPQTNTTISGTGITIDVYQNKLRIFEQGGTTRGGYWDITALTAGVGTNLMGGAGTVTSITAGGGLTGGTITGTGTITVDTGSTHFITGSVNSMNLRGVFSSSGQVSYTGLSSIPSGILSSSTQFNALTGTSASFASTASNLNGGTTNYIPLWTSATAQSSSNIFQSSGNIGIGTSSPSALLHVQGGISGSTMALSGGQTFNINDSTFNSTNFTVNSTNIIVGNDLTDIVRIGNNTLYVNNGNVAIGTTTPQNKLDVISTNIAASFGNTFSVGGIAGIHFGYLEPANALYRKSALVFERTETHNQSANASGKIHFLLDNIGSNSATTLSDSVFTIDSNASGSIGTARVGIAVRSPSSSLHILGDSLTQGLLQIQNSALAQVLYVSSSGNVGIGTTSPATALHVVGVGRFTGTNAFSIGGDTNNARIQYGAAATAFSLLTDSNSFAALSGRALSIGATYGNTTAPTNGMIIEGSLGIGTTTPGATLHVQGNVSASSYTGSILANNGIVSSSGQVSYLGLSSIPSGIVSGSTVSSPSQGTVRVTINGVNTDVDTGLQTGDSPSFVTITSTQATGTAPFTVASRTLVTNLNADLLDGLDSTSFAITGSNTFTANQTISGSLTITQNLNVLGSSSISYVSQSTLNIGTNLITVNVQNPSIRFGGLAVIDSGSSPQRSGSLLFDSVNDQWIFVHQNQTSPTSSVLLMGPQTYNNIGNETNLTNNYLLKSTNAEHVGDSQVFDNGTNVGIGTASPGAKLHIQGNVSASSYTGSLSGQASSVANTLTISSPLSGTSYNGSAAVTIALASGYGDTQNPFGSKTANHFLAAPNGSAGAPTFRAIVAADIPTLNQNTTGQAGSVANAVTFNSAGTGDVSGTTYNGSAARTISHNTIGAVTSSRTLTITTQNGLTGGTTAVDLSANRSWTLELTGQVLALHNLATSGLIARTGAGTVAGRSIAVSGTGLSISNADGVSGNPTITIGGGVISGSSASSPSQGTVRVTINGVNTDVDTGLQTGDSPSFAGLTVDTNTLFVDATNDRVGIGTVSPATNLHLKGLAGAVNCDFTHETINAGTAARTVYYRNGTVHFYAGLGAWTGNNNYEIANNLGPVLAIPSSSGNVGIGTTSPNRTLSVNGSANITGSLDVTGAFTAQTKSFKIQHQTIPNRSLVYGVLEGPEHAVYVRGRLTNKNSIILPPEWDWLIDPESITVQLTPIGSHQKLYVESIVNGVIFIQNENLLSKDIDCYYLVHATRKDVEPLQTVQ